MKRKDELYVKKTNKKTSKMFEQEKFNAQGLENGKRQFISRPFRENCSKSSIKSGKLQMLLKFQMKFPSTLKLNII